MHRAPVSQDRVCRIPTWRGSVRWVCQTFCSGQLAYCKTEDRSAPDSPTADMQHRLFDHFVGTQQKRFWNLQTERLCGRQIDDEIELGRPFNGQVRRFGTAEFFVDKIGSTAEKIEQVRPVGRQSARLESRACSVAVRP